MNRKKKFEAITHTYFDVAVGPTLAVFFGIPVLMILGVVVLTVLTVKLIVKAKNKTDEEKQEKPKRNGDDRK